MEAFDETPPPRSKAMAERVEAAERPTLPDPEDFEVAPPRRTAGVDTLRTSQSEPQRATTPTTNRATSDAILFITADENADLGVAIANAMGIRDAAGRTVLERMRLHLVGQAGGANYDGAKVSGTRTLKWCDAHQVDDCGCPEQYLVNAHSDPTGSAVLQLDEQGDQADDDLMAIARELKEINTRERSVASRIARYLARRPRGIDVAEAESDERAHGCVSCARLTDHNGDRFWSPVWRTSAVLTQRANGSTKSNEGTARLDTVTPLCRRCYDYVLATVVGGACLKLNDAIPRKVVRAWLDGKKVMRPANSKVAP